jgi:uncharacterized integral membrane protein
MEDSVNDKDTAGAPEEAPALNEDVGSFVPEPAEPADETTLLLEPETAPEPPEPGAGPEPVAVPEPEPHRVFAGTGISWAFIIGVILTAAIIVLAVQNTDLVPVQLYLWEAEAPLIIVMLVTALVAILIDELIGLVIRRRKRRVLAEREELRRLRAKADTKAPRLE